MHEWCFFLGLNSYENDVHVACFKKMVGFGLVISVLFER